VTPSISRIRDSRTGVRWDDGERHLRYLVGERNDDSVPRFEYPARDPNTGSETGNLITAPSGQRLPFQNRATSHAMIGLRTTKKQFAVGRIASAIFSAIVMPVNRQARTVDVTLSTSAGL